MLLFDFVWLSGNGVQRERRTELGLSAEAGAMWTAGDPAHVVQEDGSVVAFPQPWFPNGNEGFCGFRQRPTFFKLHGV